MPTFNERNQQILGMLALVGGQAQAQGLFGEKKQKASDRLRDKPNSAGKIIEEARAGIRKYGIEKPSLTYVGFPPPASIASKLTDARSIVDRLISLRAERVSTPGIQLATANVKRYGVGPIEKIPHSAAFGDLTISFIGDARGVIHQFFYAWMRGIVGFHDVPNGGGALDAMYERYPYEVGYRKDYSVPIQVITYDEIQEEIGTITLTNAYPIAIGEIQRGWDNINDLVRIPVTFTYTHWNYDGQLNLQLIEPSRKTLAENNSSLLSNIITGMNVLQTISSIKRPQNINDILNTVNSGSTLLKTLLPSNRINF